MDTVQSRRYMGAGKGSKPIKGMNGDEARSLMEEMMIETSAKLAMYLMGRSALTEPPLSPTEEELINETEAMEQALRELGESWVRSQSYIANLQSGQSFPSKYRDKWVVSIKAISKETKQLMENLA